MKSYSAISLFSGAGGLDYGMEQAGIKPLIAVEMMKEAAATYQSNFPDTLLINDDVRNVIDKLGSYHGSVDFVFGGPPCQGFSIAGKMDPNDDRSKLIFTFLDVVERVSPKAFIMENVKALGTLSKWSDVRSKYLLRAEELGYNTAIIQTIATDFGVPQKRERTFFIGIKDDSNLFIKAEIENCLSSQKHPAQTVKEVLSSLGPAGTEENPMTCTAKITFATNPVMRKSPYAGMYFNGQGRPINIDGYANTLPASMGGNKTPFIDEDYLLGKTPQDWVVSYHQKLMGGLAPSFAEAPSNLRRITIREAARLQTFPDDYQWRGATGKIYTQIGNAVPCRLAEAVGKAVIKYLSTHA